MIINYVGNFEPEWSTENDVRKAFECLGHEVIQIQENVPRQLVQLRDYNYDLLLITGTWDCTPDILAEYLTIFKTCAIKGIPTATLHLDTFWGTSRNNRKWWLHPMFHTAYIFTADGDYEKEWKLFGKNHVWLPPAIRHDACHFGKFREEYACDVAFVGSNGHGYHEDVWPYRKELLDSLREICARNGWSFKNPGGDDPKIDRGEDMNDFYASTKVIVGDSLCLKKEDSKYWSDRVPETLGRGGVLVMPQISALRNIYSEEVLPMYRWGDWDNLEAKLVPEVLKFDYWAVVPEMGLEQTAHDHTYVNRARTILETVFNNG